MAAFKAYTALKTIVCRVKKEILNATKEEVRRRHTDQTHTGQSIYVKPQTSQTNGLEEPYPVCVEREI